MRLDFLDILRCPVCHANLLAESLEPGDPEAQPAATGHLEVGLLRCSGGHCYPIDHGIPRLLPAGLAAFPAFVRTHHAALAARGLADSAPPPPPADRAAQTVKQQFERQWRWWGHEERLYGRTVEQMEAMLRDGYVGPDLGGDTWRGKWVLDAGCGHGAFTRGFGRLGARAVGLEFGSGVDVARAMCRDLPDVHLVQGDINAPPFAPGTFDLAFCHGALPFLRAPEQGFLALARTLKAGGYARIWVYPKGGALWEVLQNSLRAVLARLPGRLLYALCFLPVPVLSIVPTTAAPACGTAPGGSVRRSSGITTRARSSGITRRTTCGSGTPKAVSGR